MHCQKKMHRPWSFIVTVSPWLLPEHKLVPKSRRMLMIHILVSPSKGVSEGRIQKGIPPLGKTRGTLEYSHTGTYFMPSILSQTEIQRQTDLEFQILTKPILEVLTNWKTTKNGAYQQWWQLKLLIGLQGGWFSGLNEMNTAPHWTPIGSAV